MSADNGGPAFPVESIVNAHGMTLRDYFAAKAMAGMLADLPKSLYGLDWQKNVTRTAYELADQMLKERAK